MATLKTDDEFKNLIPPLSPDEYRQLEENIISDGCRDALVVWKGTVIDGHNRYEICQKHSIPFQTREKHFDSRDDAIQWIILNQFGRRNLSAGERSILALRLEPILSAKAKERMLSGKKIDPVPKSAQGVQRGKVRNQVAKLAGVGHTTIQETKQILEHWHSGAGRAD